MSQGAESDKLEQEGSDSDTPAEGKEQQVEVKEDPVGKQLAELKAYFQKELESLKPKETPKQQKQAVDAESRLKELEKELEKARAQSEMHLQTAILVQNGLVSTRFAKQLLSEYDGSKPFEQFVEECKKDKDFKLLFAPAGGTANKAPAPAAPSGGSPGAHLGNTKSAEAQLREFAETLWPDDVHRQNLYVKNRMAMEKKG